MGKSSGSRNIPGGGISAPPNPVYPRKIWTQTPFSARGWYTSAHFPVFAQSTALRSYRPVVVHPPSSSSLQLSARVTAVVVADCFDRSLRYPPWATTSRCCCCCCCFCQVVNGHAGLNCDDLFTLIVVLKRSFYL